MKKKLRTNSIKSKLVLYVLLFCIPIITFSVFNNYYSLRIIREKVYQSSMNTIYLYNSQIESSLKAVDGYLSNLGVTNNNLHSIELSDSANEQLLYTYYLQSSLDEEVTLYDNIDAFFAYIPDKNVYAFSANQLESYEQENYINTYLKDYIQKINIGQLPFSTGWNAHHIGQTYYLIRIIRVRDTYVGSWVRTENLLKKLNTIEMRSLDYMVFADVHQKLLTNDEVLLQQNIQLPKSYNDYHICKTDTGRYLIMGQCSTIGDFVLVSLINDKSLTEEFNLANTLIIFLMFFAGGLFVLFLRLVMHRIIRPIDQVVDAMQEVKKGSIDTRLILKKPTDEFEVVQNNFNDMTSQIKNLKIEVYERELDVQRARLDYYNVQVSPHFFINSMNVIYSFACMNNTDMIKDFVQCITAHFRYLLSNNSLSLLKDEITFTQNYMKMQELRMLNRFHYILETEINPGSLEMTVPCLIIQEFVSNAVKHMERHDANVVVFLKVDLSGTGSQTKINITIEDDGTGFLPEVLEILNSGKQLTDSRGGHLGIYNIQQRLKLLYGDRASWHFANRDTTGAVIQIHLPAYTDTTRTVQFEQNKGGEEHEHPGY